jgi:hypothetical protein
MTPHHFHRILVFPDSKKDRLSETVIPRPFREFYLTKPLVPSLRLHIGIHDERDFMAVGRP